MKILITGGAGFIGSHLAERCLMESDEVYIIDDLSTGSLSNLEHLIGSEAYEGRVHFVDDTIFNLDKLVDLVGTCDQVYHLAAAVGVQYIIDNPLRSIQTNVRGTDIVLEQCNRFRKKVLVASTSEVYGKHSHAPLLESDDCVYGSSGKSRWSYAAGKLIDEFLALAYYRTTGLPVIVARLFNTVGPRQSEKYGMVIPRFLQQALAGAPITVYGDGSQTRTFTHVSEVVSSFRRLMAEPGAVGQVVNIGGVEEVSILDLASRVRRAVGSNSEIRLVPYSEAYPRDFEDMGRRVPSTEKLQKLTGSAPAMKLNEILEECMGFERDRLLNRPRTLQKNG